MRLRSVSGTCKSVIYMGSFACVFLGGSHVNFMNGGNYKGSALVGVVTNFVRPSSNRMRVKRAVGVKCFNRRISVRPRLQIVSCIGRTTRFIHATSKLISTSTVLRQFLFPPRRRCDPMNGLSNKRGEELCLLHILVDTPGMLVLSRPAGSLSIRALTVLRSCLSNCSKVIVAMSRSECFLSEVTGHVFTFRKTKGVMRCRNKCASCVGGHPRPTSKGAMSRGTSSAKTSTSKTRKGATSSNASSGRTQGGGSVRA